LRAAPGAVLEVVGSRVVVQSNRTEKMKRNSTCKAGLHGTLIPILILFGIIIFISLFTYFITVGLWVTAYFPGSR
jgi:hypothetical protein